MSVRNSSLFHEYPVQNYRKVKEILQQVKDNSIFDKVRVPVYFPENIFSVLLESATMSGNKVHRVY